MPNPPIVVRKRDVKRGMWRYPLKIAAAVAAVPLFYVLSLGPVLFMSDSLALKGNGPIAYSIGMFYAPLLALETSDSPAGRAFVKYLALWGFKRTEKK
jgi:hypothetical protein